MTNSRHPALSVHRATLWVSAAFDRTFKTRAMKKEYWIRVGHVDNRLVIFLNGQLVYDSGIIHDDPDLHKNVDLSDKLNLQENFPNELIFEGFNDTFSDHGESEAMNPWHFSYRVVGLTRDDAGQIVDEHDIVKPFDEKHYSNPNIRALNNVYVLKMRAGEVKVVSNALSQQFSE